jgi:7,8-dihydropterin-6-yl-methyl-4-(beta-D-ribofuranosyl)aminobenzene 5'-phosphate synthase
MTDSLSYTILVDNDAHAPGLATEHGLSIRIDTGETRILFDAGQSGAFLENAQTLGIDLSTADHLVLSHGHYDHAGGFADLEGILPEGTPIHAHPGIFPERYSRHSDGTMRDVGLPGSARQFLRRREAYFHPTPDAAEIAPRIWVTGFVPRVTPFEDTGGDFWLDRECTRPDSIEDDMALWAERPEGLWIFLGCAHAGTINTIRHIQTVSGREDVYAVIGGTHLRSASEERLEKTARFLTDLAPTVLLPCHCSGRGICTMLSIESPELPGGDCHAAR